MDFRRLLAKRTAVWLVLGLVGGGIAADGWWRQHTKAVNQELKQMQASAEADRAQAGKAASQLAATGAEMTRLKEEVNRLTEQLKSERELRHRYEVLISRGQK